MYVGPSHFIPHFLYCPSLFSVLWFLCASFWIVSSDTSFSLLFSFQPCLIWNLSIGFFILIIIFFQFQILCWSFSNLLCHFLYFPVPCRKCQAWPLYFLKCREDSCVKAVPVIISVWSLHGSVCFCCPLSLHILTYGVLSLHMSSYSWLYILGCIWENDFKSNLRLKLMLFSPRKDFSLVSLRCLWG